MNATTHGNAPRGPRRGSAPQRRVLNEAETAAYVGLSERQLQRLRAQGGGPQFVRLGDRRVGYCVEDLDAWLQARKFQSTSAEAVAARVGGRAA